MLLLLFDKPYSTSDLFLKLFCYVLLELRIFLKLPVLFVMLFLLFDMPYSTSDLFLKLFCYVLLEPRVFQKHHLYLTTSKVCIHSTLSIPHLGEYRCGVVCR